MKLLTRKVKLMNTKPKLLYLITLSESGGAQTYVLNLASYLQSDFQILVASSGQTSDWLATKLKNSQLNWQALVNLQRAINPLADWRALWEIRRLVKEFQPDIIHFNSSKVSILGSLACLGIKAKKIYTAHGWVFLEPVNWFYKIFYLAAEKLTAYFKDKIICVSEYDRAAARKVCINRKKLITIHNGINTDTIKLLSKDEAKQFINSKFQILNSKFYIGTIANLYKTKNLHALIKSAKKLIDNGLDCSFVVIGEGPERKSLEADIAKQKLNNNFFLIGQIERAYLYLKAFDVFVLPSVKEGLPYTLLEAMLAGLPIVATRVGGMFEMLEFYPQSHYRLVPPTNHQALVLALQEMLEKNPLENNLLESVRENINIKTMVKATKEVYLD